MYTENKSNFFKILLFTSFIIGVIITGIVSSLSILKDEAINNHLKIANLQSNILSEQITQTISSSELIINNIQSSMHYKNSLKELFISIYFR